MASVSPKALLSNLAIGKLTLAAILVGLVAFLSAVIAGHNAGEAFALALLATSAVAGILAALHQYSATGSVPGTLISVGALASILLNVLVALIPQLLTTPQTAWGLAGFALVYLVKVEETLMATPSSPSPAPTSSPPSSPAPAAPASSASSSSAAAIAEIEKTLAELKAKV